jgi:hypothetical protein
MVGHTSGILGHSVGMSPLACSGQNTKMSVYIDNSSLAESDCNGFRLHQVHIPGSVLCDASGVIHAGALRVHKIDIADGLQYGVVALKENGCALPSVNRTTIVTPSGNIAGMHCCGNGLSSSVELCNSVASMLPNCAYAAPTMCAETAQKNDHLTCKWAGRIGTTMDDISNTCIDLSSAAEPMYGIPLCSTPGQPPCCLSKFATDLYAANNIAKVKQCFGQTADVVRGSNGLPMLRVRGKDGIDKVAAAKAQLCANMKPAFLHHGMNVLVYTPDCVKFKPGMVHLELHRDAGGGFVTQKMIGDKLNIAISNPIGTIDVTPDSIAADLASALVIPSQDASSAIAAAAVSIIPTAEGSSC